MNSGGSLQFEREILNHPISSKNIEKLVRIESALAELTMIRDRYGKRCKG